MICAFPGAVKCGNGVVDTDEECDPARGTTTPGCSECKVQFGWKCTRMVGKPSICTRRVFVDLSARSLVMCAVDMDGDASCKGSDGMEVRDVKNPTVGKFNRIAVASYHACARHMDGRIFCWGSNKDHAIDVPDLGLADALSAGVYHTCALVGSRAQCWGRNAEAQTTAPNINFTAISGGAYHTCGIDTARHLHCWGYDGDGRATPPQAPARSVGIGYFHGCAVMDTGSILCWGLECSGCDRVLPPSGNDFTTVSCGQDICCALHSDGSPTCWGHDDKDREFGPYAPTSERFQKITIGSSFACGLRVDGSILCFGTDQSLVPLGDTRDGR